MEETLKEAALKYASEKLRRVIIPYKEFNANVAEYVGFVNGANWQAERMYNEEDMRIAYLTNPNHLGTFEEFIKEFKNK